MICHSLLTYAWELEEREIKVMGIYVIICFS